MKYLWDKEQTRSVVASKLREINIHSEPSQNFPWKVLGWYNSHDYFYFGSFESVGDARFFILSLHERMET